MKITNAADIRTFLKGFYDQHITALNGMLDKLPEPMRAEFTKLRDGLNAQLEKLPPLDQVPAAQDAAWAFQSFADAWTRMAEYSNGLRERLTALSGELAAKATALNGLEEQVKDGRLITKEKSTEACELAKAEGIKNVLPEILATRKSALETCGLPVPPDAILSLPSKDYEPKLAAAKEQVGKLNAKGLKLGGKGAAWVTSMAWLGTTEFNGQMTALNEILGTVKETRQPAGDPLLGGAPAAEPQDKNAPALTLA